jgi:hypothetical protein
MVSRAGAQAAPLLREWNFDLALAFTSFSQSPHPPAFVWGMTGIPRFFGISFCSNRWESR